MVGELVSALVMTCKKFDWVDKNDKKLERKLRSVAQATSVLISSFQLPRTASTRSNFALVTMQADEVSRISKLLVMAGCTCLPES